MYSIPYPVPALLEERFWEKVRTAEDCLIWIGGATTAGYGLVGWDGGRIYTHRLSWVIHFGPVPEGLSVLHDCPGGDNPSCNDPEHLWTGTQKDNMRDCSNKGRMVAQAKPYLMSKGEHRYNAKLNNEAVLHILSLPDPPPGKIESFLQAVADNYGVGSTTIRNVRSGKGWKHVSK